MFKKLPGWIGIIFSLPMIAKQVGEVFGFSIPEIGDVSDLFIAIGGALGLPLVAVSEPVITKKDKK